MNSQPKTSKAEATPQLNMMISAARDGDVAETSVALKGEWASDAAVQEVRKRVHEYDALCKVVEAAENLYLKESTIIRHELVRQLLDAFNALDTLRAKEGK